MLVEPLETINGSLDIKEQGSEQSSRSHGKDVIHSAPTPLARNGNGTIRSIDTMLMWQQSKHL